VANLLQISAAITIGLLAFNIDVFQIDFIHQNLEALVRPVQILFGLSGLIGLVQVFTGLEI